MLIKENSGSRFKWYFPSLMMLLLAVGVASSFYIYQSVTESSKQSLVSRASSIAHALSPTEILLLAGDYTDIENPAYIEVKDKMTKILDVNSDSQFVYLMGKRIGMSGRPEVFFFVDSEPTDSEDYSPPGQIYFEESEAIDMAFNQGVASVEGPTTDRWGTWITGIAPIVDRQGEVVAIAGIDVDAISYRNRAVALASIPLLIILCLIIFVYFGAKLRKKEADLLALKEQFVALATHEIRSPLTGIVWTLSQFLRKETIHSKELEPIEHATTKLVESVNDILYSFSLETNAKPWKKIDVSSLVSISVAALMSNAEKKNIKIKFTRLPDVYIIGDESQLEHVFTNVISNAIKYSPEGSEVEVIQVKEKKTVCISVIDHGIGIPQKDQTKVFGGFFRAPNAIAYAETGTGLGLYIVNQVVKAHNGTVIIESAEGVGTKIHIRFSLV